jgi:Domain of Unknown Function (DUF1080)
MRYSFPWILALAAMTGAAAERQFDFSDVREGQIPAGFRSTVTGRGKPGDWKVVLDAAAPLLAPLAPQARSVKAVLAQTAQDPTDEHYPLLVFEDESFGDFVLTTRFKIVSGVAEQMAGIAFRIQDEKNYYYVRASALGNSFCFFKFVNGLLVGPVKANLEITQGSWHDLAVECKGSLVTCSLDGKVIFGQMREEEFPKGKVGFWTKSDSVSYFADTKITFSPLVDPAQAIVREVARKYSRLVGLKISVLGQDRKTTRTVASKVPAEVGQAGGKSEFEVITHGTVYYGKEKDTVAVIMPLRDRNGEIIAAARVILGTFPGQTEENAIGRAVPVVREVQGHIQSLDDLVQ